MKKIGLIGIVLMVIVCAGWVGWTNMQWHSYTAKHSIKVYEAVNLEKIPPITSYLAEKHNEDVPFQILKEKAKRLGMNTPTHLQDVNGTAGAKKQKERNNEKRKNYHFQIEKHYEKKFGKKSL